MGMGVGHGAGGNLRPEWPGQQGEDQPKGVGLPTLEFARCLVAIVAQLHGGGTYKSNLGRRHGRGAAEDATHGLGRDSGSLGEVADANSHWSSFSTIAPL